MDLAFISLCVSIGTLAVSAISPIIVKLIENRHARKMKKIELFAENRMRASEEYLQCLSKCRKNKYGKALDEYSVAYGNALLFASDSTRALMNEIDSYIDAKVYDDKSSQGIILPQDKLDSL